MNLIMIDVINVQQACDWVCDIWAMPFTIITYSYLMSLYLGYAAWVGAGTMAALISINLYGLNMFYNLQEKRMSRTDDRLKSLAEVFNGIKVQTKQKSKNMPKLHQDICKFYNCCTVTSKY